MVGEVKVSAVAGGLGDGRAKAAIAGAASPLYKKVGVTC